ncbi:hypothetical protein [Polycyclovorans algicola]|uniref:hypothetical protein n=1 Tax=Polycyclovorans algicola TaxID=616992 RepID=UPI001268E7AA|nr:hypothetical protein [Polycyclovorans algicola]
MLGLRMLGRSPALGLALLGLMSLAPGAQAVVPCTVATQVGPETHLAATLGDCVARLQRAEAVPDADGRIYGQYGPIRLAVSPRRALRFYDDSHTWSVLQGHGGWIGRSPAKPPVRVARARSAIGQTPALPTDAASAQPTAMTSPARTHGARRPTFAEALEAALAAPLPAPVAPALKPVPDTLRLLQRALISHGFQARSPKGGGCGVQVDQQWYRLTTASLPDCALQLASVGRKAPRLRLVTAEWNGQALWLGPDAVYQKSRNGWAVAAGY